jgi:preprotein translocase subunit SecG
MLTFIGILSIIVSIALIFVVLVQNPKGGGISSSFGAPGQLGGVKRASDFIEKATWTLAGTLGALALVAVILVENPNRPQQNETEQVDQQEGGDQQGSGQQGGGQQGGGQQGGGQQGGQQNQ